MTRMPYAILLVLVVGLVPALAAGQETADAWLDGEALMLEMLSPAALDEAVLEQFHPDCKIALDSVMTRYIRELPAQPGSGAPPCREPQHWEAVRQYANEFRTRNDTAARFMRPSGIGAPWMVRYAVRCRHVCRGGMVGFEVRFTYDGRQVTRVEVQAR